MELIPKGLIWFKPYQVQQHRLGSSIGFRVFPRAPDAPRCDIVHLSANWLDQSAKLTSATSVLAVPQPLPARISSRGHSALHSAYLVLGRFKYTAALIDVGNVIRHLPPRDLGSESRRARLDLSSSASYRCGVSRSILCKRS